MSIPNRVAVIGPIVEPQAMLLRDAKYCMGTFALLQASTKGVMEDELVA